MTEPQALIRTGVAVLLVFAAGLAAIAALKASRSIRTASLSCLGMFALLAPLLVPLPHTALRWAVSLAAITVAVKLYDLHRTADAGPVPDARTLLLYLPNEGDLVLRNREPAARPSRREDAMRLMGLVPAAVAAAVLVVAVFRVEWPGYPWVVEHAVKVSSVLAFLQFATNIGACARRLAGVRAMDFSGWFFASATPAEFWRRWNRPAGRFLFEYVYSPAGGSRRPLRAVLAAFAVNGLVHEYVFGIAAGRVPGWALAFFLLEGMATAATLRLRPAGWGRAVGVPLTLLFNLGASVLVFRCIDAILPFYARRV